MTQGNAQPFARCPETFLGSFIDTENTVFPFQELIIHCFQTVPGESGHCVCVCVCVCIGGGGVSSKIISLNKENGTDQSYIKEDGDFPCGPVDKKPPSNA